MIELRWLVREAPVHCITYDTFLGTAKDHGPTGEMTTERVLQFRTQIMQIGYGYTTDGNGAVQRYERPMGFGWSEWQDVPEQSDAAGDKE